MLFLSSRKHGHGLPVLLLALPPALYPALSSGAWCGQVTLAMRWEIIATRPGATSSIHGVVKMLSG